MSIEPNKIDVAYKLYGSNKLTSDAVIEAINALQAKWCELELPRGADAAKERMLEIFSYHINPNMMSRVPVKERPYNPTLKLVKLDLMAQPQQATSFNEFLADLREAEQEVMTLFRKHPEALGIQKIDETVLVDAVRATFNIVAEAAISTVQRGRGLA